MENKKIKIFLGAYVNFPNAQNVNCANIARYLNKDKFEVHTMYMNKLPVDKKLYKEQGVYLHRLIHHRFIWWWCKYLTMLFGKYDIYYIPKGETVDLCFCKRHKKKAVFISSVEGVVGEQIPKEDSIAREKYLMMNDIFSISSCIQESVKKYWGINTEILYLGVNSLNKKIQPKKSVKKIIWIGSVIDRKRPEYLVECAEKFPKLEFIMIGDGDAQIKIRNMIQEKRIKNIQLLGRISNEEVYEKLSSCDLLLMTSDKEGLPKVIGEAMISGVPAIYINECYDVDYIQDGVNGYAVPNLEVMIERINTLTNNPQRYQQMSINALQTIQEYTWKNLIKKYEDYFTKQYLKS